MPRRILLIEPNYKNKYPPIGLMKISSYHKLIGDKVTFFKGNVFDLIVDGKAKSCIRKLKRLDGRYNWDAKEVLIRKYMRSHRIADLEAIMSTINSTNSEEIEKSLKFYCHKFSPQNYDRIYVTSLFTFYWSITIKTIHQAKSLVKKESELLIGGVMASLLPNEIEKETGIKPIEGLLDKPGMLDPGNRLIVDQLELDYSILDEIDYKYPTGSAYFTFMTKGCTRKCKFCSVPILEPVYKDKVSSINLFQSIADTYGDQRNLLLMDNNVLASPRFPEIIEEIKLMGFGKGAKFVEPNQLDLAVSNLKSGINDVAFLNRTHRLLQDFIKRRVKGNQKKRISDILRVHELMERQTMTKRNVMKAYDLIKDDYEKYRNKVPVERYVDFNQGIDGRYVTDENMKLLSEINVRPLRIAFDYIGMSKQYVEAVELAAKYGLKDLSNYLLYNFKDRPEDLYNRMKINIDLNRKYDLKIFSFPMKYIPLFGEEAKDRKHISKHWNRKFIRTIQAILNVSKGIVAPGGSFFEMAFGKDINEFRELLYMPEALIIYRNKFKDSGITDQWRNDFNGLSPQELEEAKHIIEANEFDQLELKTNNPNILKVLLYYTINTKDVESEDIDTKELRRYVNELLKKDQFLELTLTYDYHGKVPLAKVV